MRFVDMLRAILRAPDVVAAVGKAVTEAKRESAQSAKATAEAIKRVAESRSLAIRHDDAYR